MKKLIIPFTVIIMLILPFVTLGSIGVGVGTGKIQVDQILKPGLIYTIPPLTVVNTGDEPVEYTVSIDYNSKQTELKPNKEWFSFDPLVFHLEPSVSQVVQIKLTLPVKIAPGDYFAYVQGQPVQKVSTIGGTSIGVAAAAKLYFTVAPANIFQGIYYRFISLYSRYHPWDTIILAMVFVAVLIRFLSKKFKFQIAKK